MILGCVKSVEVYTRMMTMMCVSRGWDVTPVIDGSIVAVWGLPGYPKDFGLANIV